jgi:hypothetical protein
MDFTSFILVTTGFLAGMALRERKKLYAQLLHFFIVVLAVKDVPFLRPFQNGPLLGIDLLPRSLIDSRFLV